MNGNLSNSFAIKCGVCQGDSLSCFLFNISTVPLILTWEKQKMIMNLPNHLHFIPTALQYADNTCFFSYNRLHFNQQMKSVETYEKASASKVNLQKSKYIAQTNFNTSSLSISVIPDTEYISYLGFKFNKEGLITSDST